MSGYWEELATMEPQLSGDSVALFGMFHFLMRLRPEFEFGPSNGLPLMGALSFC